jgi:23S rRNA pseudouridine1911/1915/1917 synthase
MVEKKEITITSDSSAVNRRIDQFLFTTFPEFSRSYFQQLIEQDAITVNQKLVKSSYKLKSGDHVHVAFRATHTFDLVPEDAAFDIIDEQDDFLIVNKPAGLLVHNVESHNDEPSLVRGLLFRFPEFVQFENIERPGIVHRLDKDTSGLMIVARNPIAQKKFSEMFKNRTMKKTYLAVVTTHPDKEGVITDAIGRHPRMRHKMTARGGLNARDSETRYEVLEYFEDTSLVAAYPVTGRTHQIRVHMASIGHGLIGDCIYGSKSLLIKRQALHAHKLSFEYNGKQYDYALNPPKDFNHLVELYRKTTN